MADVADLQMVAEQIASGILFCQGENCSASSRLIVHEKVKYRLLEKITPTFESWRRAFSTLEPLELPPRPSCESLIEVTEHLNALRAVKPPVVVHPSPHHRVGQASQILQTLVVPGGRHSPLANGLPDRLGGLGADRRQEADEVLPPAVLRASRLEGVAEEVELDMFVPPRPVVILAVHDPGLLRMKLQAAFCKATPDGLQHRSSFLLAPAVDDGIVRITLEADARIVPLHPQIERVVQEQIGQQRTNDTALRGSLRPLHERSVRTFDRGRSHRPMYRRTQARSVWWATARSTRSCGMESKNALMSRSMTQSVAQQRFRAIPTASSAERPGR